MVQHQASANLVFSGNQKTPTPLTSPHPTSSHLTSPHLTSPSTSLDFPFMTTVGHNDNEYDLLS